MIAKFRQRYASMAKPAKAALWLTVCNFVVRGIGFIVAPILTRILSTEEYGVLSVYNSYGTILLILATWEIQLGAYTRGIYKYKEEIDVFTTATQCLVNLLTTAVFVLAIVFRHQVQAFTGIPMHLYPVMYLYYLVFPAYTMWMTRKRVDYDYRPVGAATILYTILGSVLPIFSLLVLGATAEVQYASTLLFVSVLCVVMWLPHANYVSLRKNVARTKEYWLFLIRFEAPLILHSLSFFILNQSDRIMIGSMQGSREAAIYSLAYTLSLAISILETSVDQVMGPWRYEMLEKKNYGSIRKISSLTLAMFGVAILAFTLVVPEVLLIFPEQYGESIWCMPPIAASVFFTYLYSIFVGVESYFERTRYVMYVSVVCSSINIGLNYLLIPVYGYVACAYTTLFSYALFAVGHYVFMRMTLKEVGVDEQVVNIKTIMGIALVFLLGVAVVLSLYRFPVGRYAVFLAICAVAFVKRDMVKSLLAKVRKSEA